MHKFREGLKWGGANSYGSNTQTHTHTELHTELESGERLDTKKKNSLLLCSSDDGQGEESIAHTVPIFFPIFWPIYFIWKDFFLWGSNHSADMSSRDVTALLARLSCQALFRLRWKQVYSRQQTRCHHRGWEQDSKNTWDQHIMPATLMANGTAIQN